MKELQSLYTKNLQNMEFVPMIRETVSDIEAIVSQMSTADAPLNRFVADMKTGVDAFEIATRNPTKDPFVKLYAELDKKRDADFRRFGRRLALFELSDNETELAAHAALEPLWQLHKSTPNLNRAKQTGATDNFLNDTQKEPFAQAIATLAMQADVDAIRKSNDSYRAAGEESRAKAAAEATDKAKDLRRSTGETYSFACNYIWTMANALPDNADWDKMLAHINLIRKRYNELINRRRATGKSAAEVPDTEAPK